MSRRKKQKGISSESKTCFIFAIAFLVIGIGSIIYGKKFYHPEDMVDPEDIITGQTATVVSVEKRDRNLSFKDKELERKKGFSDDEIRWEYYVVYSVKADGNEYTYEDIKPYKDNGNNMPQVGDTEVINYAIKNGEFIINPETQDVNGTIIVGWILVILSVIAAGVGIFLRK